MKEIVYVEFVAVMIVYWTVLLSVGKRPRIVKSPKFGTLPSTSNVPEVLVMLPVTLYVPGVNL